MLIVYCDYWQTNISLHVQIDLNVNGFTTLAEKVRGRSLFSCKDFKDQSNLGTQDMSEKFYEGYPITQENVKQRQTGDIYLLAYFLKGQRSTLLLDSVTVFCRNKAESFSVWNTSSG